MSYTLELQLVIGEGGVGGTSQNNGDDSTLTYSSTTVTASGGTYSANPNSSSKYGYGGNSGSNGTLYTGGTALQSTYSGVYGTDGGGGGGAGASSNGGNGSNYSFPGGSGGNGYLFTNGIYYGGGGGGGGFENSASERGSGGDGGGGAGGSGTDFSGVDGTANTGGGGGGGGNGSATYPFLGYTSSGSGGSGVLVIGYDAVQVSLTPAPSSSTTVEGTTYATYNSSGTIILSSLSADTNTTYILVGGGASGALGYSNNNNIGYAGGGGGGGQIITGTLLNSYTGNSCNTEATITSFSFADLIQFSVKTTTGNTAEVFGPLVWTDMLGGISSTYIYASATINGLTYAVFCPSSLTLTDDSDNLYTFTSKLSSGVYQGYEYTNSTSGQSTQILGGIVFTTYNIAATNNQISTSTSEVPVGLDITNCSIPDNFNVSVNQTFQENGAGPQASSSITTYNSIFYPSPAGSTINPTSCAYAGTNNTVYIGPGFVYGGGSGTSTQNLMFYSLNPWGDPSNTSVNSLPYSLGSSNNNTSTGTNFSPYSNQYFGNQFSLPGSSVSLTGNNILFLPYTNSSNELEVAAMSFFLYSPYTTDTYIYNESAPTGNVTTSNPTAPVTFPYAGYAGYLFAYYDYTNSDLPTEYKNLELSSSYTPFMFDSQNFPSINSSCPSGSFCFQSWSGNNVQGNVPDSSFWSSSTTMENPITGTVYKLFGAIPVCFASANTNYTIKPDSDANGLSEIIITSTLTPSAQGQYIGNATFSSVSGIGGAPFCTGTLIVGSFNNTVCNLSTFFGSYNLTSDQQSL